MKEPICTCGSDCAPGNMHHPSCPSSPESLGVARSHFADFANARFKEAVFESPAKCDEGGTYAEGMRKALEDIAACSDNFAGAVDTFHFMRNLARAALAKNPSPSGQVASEPSNEGSGPVGLGPVQVSSQNHCPEDEEAIIEARHAALAVMAGVQAAYLKDYEFTDGETFEHSPSETELAMIEDAINGLLAESEFVAAFEAWRKLCQPKTRLLENSTKVEP